MPRINDRLTIPDAELTFTASTGSGPGGQSVNRVATRITLRFDVDESPSLSATQKRRIHDVLATRISRAGILRVVSSRHRSQLANRKATIARFSELLANALRRRRPRKRRGVPAAQRRRRLEQKRRRGAVKQLRSRPGDS